LLSPPLDMQQATKCGDLDDLDEWDEESLPEDERTDDLYDRDEWDEEWSEDDDDEARQSLRMLKRLKGHEKSSTDYTKSLITPLKGNRFLDGVPDCMNRSAKVGKKRGSPIASEKECHERSKGSAKKQKLIMADYSSRHSDTASSSMTGSVNDAAPSIDRIIMSAEHARRDAWNQREAESVAREAKSKAREAESVARLAEVDARTTRLIVSQILRITRELRDHTLPSDVRYILESELKQQKLKWHARQADTSNKRQETTITEQEDGEDLGPASSAPGQNA